MSTQRTRALSDVLDQLESVAHDDSIPISEVVEHLEHKSFASLASSHWYPRHLQAEFPALPQP